MLNAGYEVLWYNPVQTRYSKSYLLSEKHAGEDVSQSVWSSQSPKKYIHTADEQVHLHGEKRSISSGQYTGIQRVKIAGFNSVVRLK